jgi:hypothetical protein
LEGVLAQLQGNSHLGSSFWDLHADLDDMDEEEVLALESCI